MNDKIVQYRKLKLIYNLDIRGFDEDNLKDRDFLLSLIRQISFGKNIFMSYFMGVINTINSESILFSYEDPKKPYRGKLQIDPDQFRLTKTIFENRNTAFYIFDQSVTWDDFMSIKKLSSYQTFKKSSLSAVINLYHLDGLNIAIRKECEISLDSVLARFKAQRYMIKKYLL